MSDIHVPAGVLPASRTSSTSSRRPSLQRASRLLSLEQRFMFDGAAVATAADAAHSNDTHDAAHAAEAASAAARAAEAAAAHVVRAADPGVNEGKKEVVFVDTSLANYQTLEAGVRVGVAIVEFDGRADGLVQIAQWARDNTGYDAIHIFSHGSEGVLNLGSMVLDQAALASETVKTELADIGRALNAGGDLLLYGCNVGAGIDGQLLINDIARLTGADVAASTDPTGAADKGGNWVLESQVGHIDVASLEMGDYDGLLQLYRVSAGDLPSGSNSIIKAIAGANFVFFAPAGGGDRLIFRSDAGDGGIASNSGLYVGITTQGNNLFSIYSVTVSGMSRTTLDFHVERKDGSTARFFLDYNPINGSQTFDLTNYASNIVYIVFNGYSSNTLFQNFVLGTPTEPVTVRDSNITITSTGTGTGGAYKIGDRVTARWDDSLTGDNNERISTATFDFSQFGGSSTVAGTNSNGIWTASYIITAGNIDAVNRNVSVRAVNFFGTAGSGSDSTNLTVDNIAPIVTSARIATTGATGAGGVYKIGDVVTITWNDTATGDNNSDVISGVKVDFSQFGGALVSATNAGGSWSASYTIAAGSIDAVNRTASVTVTDNAGNATSRSSAGVKVDNIAPTVSITSNISYLAAAETAIITFNFSEDPGTSFTWNGSSGDVVVTGGLLSAISGTGLTRTATFTPTAGVNNGSATITVAAGSYTDVPGNGGSAANTLVLPYDTRVPDAPSVPAMTSATDTGVSNSDAITRNTTPTFTGTAEAGATVVLYDTNGTTELGRTVANGSGNWSITSSSLSGGNHSIQAVAVDASGNVSPGSASLLVDIDTTPPTLTITSNAATLASGQSATITFTFSEDPGNTFAWNGSSGDIVVTGGTLSAISGNGLTRTAIFTPTANVNSGTASITVAAGSYTDVAGNGGGAGATPSITFDTLAPNAPSAPIMSSASDTGISNSDNITRNTTPTFSGTAEAGSTVRLYDTDGVTVLGTAVATGGNWSITTSALGQGAHTITARATDSAGNLGARSGGLGVTIDTTPPTLVITSNLASIKSGETATITFTFSEDPGSTFSWNGSSGDVAVSGGTLSAITGTGLTRTASFVPTANVNGGSASITVAAGSYTDAAGNNGGAGVSPTITFDTKAPNAPSTPVMASASDTGISNSDNITRNTTPTFTGTAEAGATVVLYDTNGITVLGSTTANGSGNWSITTSVLGDGTHVLQAAAVDAAGNISPRSPTLVIVIDTIAPGVTITSNAAALAAGQSATITFTFSEDPGSTFTWDGSSGDIVVSGGTLSAISGNGLTRTAIFTPTPGVNGGTASITVAAGSYTDVAGNNGGAGATPSITFDTLAPNAPSAPVMNSASDTGVSNSDNITRNTTPTFTGTAEAGATVRLYDTDGVTVLGTAVATGGNWSITTSALGQGAHTITARATDSAGNLGARSGGLNVTIDTTPPTVVITSNLSAIKSGETATITFTFSEDPGTTFDWDGSSGDIVVTGGTLSAITGSGLARTAIFTPTDHVANGTASITITAGSYTDVAGNGGGAGASPALAFNTTTPDAPSAPVMTSASDTGVSNSDGITSTTTPTFTGTAEAGTTVTLYDTDGVTVLGTAATTGGVWTITTSALAEGSHTLRAIASDGFGNVGSLSAATTVRIDTTPSTLAITSNVASLKSGETATITFTFSEDPGSTFTWDGSSGDIAVSGGTLSAITGSGLTRTAIFTPTDHVGGGTAGITVAAGSYTDVAGNSGGAAALPSLTFNTLVPSAPSAPVMTSASDTGVSNSDGITSTTTPTFTGTAEAGTTVTLYDTDGVTVLGTAVATGGNWSITTAVLGEGSHTLRAIATDGSGNVSGLSAATAIVIDTTPSTLVITSNVAALKGGETATVTFTFSEDPGSTFTWDGSSGDIVVTGGTLSALTGSGLTRTAVFTPTANVNNGVAGITVAAGSYTDAAGNSGAAGSTPALTFDTLAPNPPSTPAINGASTTNNTTPTFTGTAEAGATVRLYDTDGVTVLGTAVALGGNWSITTAALGEGVHTVTARATDGAGNVSGASSSAGVTIDITPPAVSISSNITTLTAGATATLTFSFSEDPGSSFDLGDVTATGGTLSALSGSGLTRTAVFTPTAGINNGSGTVSVAAGSYTDAAGNNGGSASLLLVIDTLPPDPPSGLTLVGGINNSTNSTTPTISGLATAGSQVTITLYGTNGITVLGTTTTADGTWSIVSAAMTEGVHTVSALSTDQAGNSSAVSAGLTIIIDITPPTVVIASNVASLRSGETASITFSFSEDPGSTFNWDGSSGDVVVTGGTLSAITGSGLIRTAIFTPTPGLDGGTASITVTGGSYTDMVGNSGGAGVTPTLVFDTLAPNAPSAPVMSSASDTGVSNSDNITRNTTPTFSGTAEAGSTVALYDSDGVTVLGTGVAAGGNWTITVSTLGEGTHAITARATDVAGNLGVPSGVLEVVIDTTPPTVLISSITGSLGVGDTALITFTFSKDPGATFAWDGSSGDVVVSGGTLSAMTGTGATRTAVFTPTAGINGGTASITIAAGSYTDVAGNGGLAGITPALVFDTLAPNVPSIPVLASASDTGASNSDGVTRDPTPTFAGTAEPGVTVTLYDTDGLTALGSGVADGSGHWSITVLPLGEGTHIIDAKATDAAGNSSGDSLAVGVTIITTPPPQTVTGINVSLPGGVSSGTIVTSSTSHTISGALSAPLGQYQSVQVSLDNGATWSTADATLGGSTWRIDGVLDAAGSTLLVRVEDLAGNVGASWSQPYVVDTVAPTVLSVAAPPDRTYTLGQNLDFIVHFSEAVVVAAGVVPSISLTLDTGGTVQASYVSGSGTSDLVFRYTVANDAQDFTGVTLGATLGEVQQISDIAGNAAAAALNGVASTALVNVDGLDARPVSVSVLNGNGAYGAGTTISIAVTYDRPVLVDLFGGSPSLALNSGGVATYAGGNGTTTLLFTYTVQPGQNAAGLDLGSTVLLNGGIIIDAGGGQSDVQLALSPALSLQAGVVIDTDPPLAPVIDRIDTSGRQPVLGGTATLSSGERLTVAVGGATYNVSVDGNGSWSLDLASAMPVGGSLSLIPGGSYAINVTVTDLAGNSTSTLATLTTLAFSNASGPVARAPVNSPFGPLWIAAGSWSSRSASVGSNDGSGGGDGSERIGFAPDYALPEWNRDQFLGQQESGDANWAGQLDTPGTQSRLTLGGGFAVAVIPRPDAALVLNRGIPDQSLPTTSYAEFFVPADAFAHGETRASVQLSATQQDGTPLPSWISFNPATGKFIVDAKACVTADVSVKLVARDHQGKAVAAQFHIRVGEQGGGGGGASNAGCVALSEQIRLAALPHQDGADLYLVRLAAGLPALAG